MSLLGARLVALVSLFGLTMTAGLGPVIMFILWKRRQERTTGLDDLGEPLGAADHGEKPKGTSEKTLHLLLVFGGGVLLATCFVHMIPEIQENYRNYLSMSAVDPRGSDKTPWVEICICLGLFLTYFIEEIILVLIGQSHHHHHGDHLEIIGCLPEEGVIGDYGTLIRPVNSCKKTADDLVNNGQSRSRQSSNDTFTKSVYDNGAIVDLQANSPSRLALERVVSRHVQDKTDSQWTRFARGLIIVVAFLAHSIFDGVAIGLQSTASSLWTMFFAICLHKLVVVFAIGFELYEKTSSLAMTSIHITLFSAMSPLGIILAILTEKGLSEDGSLTLILLNAAATGAILYIVFLEILQADRCPEINGLAQLSALVIGFALMTLMTLEVSDGD